MKKYLIINADDYGSCFAANEAIERLFDRGAITTTTLMVPCPWAEDAIRRAQRNPRIKTGLHTTLTSEYETYRWGPVREGCASLRDPLGYFYRTAADCLRHAREEDVRQELQAQYDWMESRGVHPEHIDNHMATTYDRFLPVIYRMCAEHRLGFRLPRIPETFDPNVTPERKAAFRQAAAEADRLGILLPDGLFTYDFDVAPGDTYETFRGYYMKMLDNCPEGVSELFIHPCIETEELKYINAQWKKRVWEYQVVLDPAFTQRLRENGIVLCTYADAPFTAAPL